ncbi:hypothetical protein KSP39_PZI011929 [Platanthera zijinensis]|uniref:Myb/SANT-like domain-containing protein n=1 Tax=Platanthera zijinensis TaxID=2320716 RepID=A0AAP0G4X4_9ASPA
MGKQKTVGVSASWENAQVHVFCDICIREIDLGNRPTTHFSKEGWKNVIDNFKARTGLTYDRAQLKNKWDQLKRDWKLWRDLKRGETGLGWNPIKKTIDASDEWWKERIEMLPAAKKFRFVGIAPDLEEKLDRMFSQVVANGENVWIPSTGAMPPKGKKQIMESHIEKLVESSKSVASSFLMPAKPPNVYLLNEALDELEKYPEIYEDKKFYDWATLFLMTLINGATFMGIPSDKRLEWLQNRYMHSSS